MQGETVSIEFSSADASTAAAVTLKDAAGVTRVLASNEILLIDNLNAAIAGSITVTVISDNDADGNIDAGERLAVLTAATVVAEFEGEGQPSKMGVTPKVKASGSGQVDITGIGRIIKNGSVLGVTRPSYKETFGGH